MTERLKLAQELLVMAADGLAESGQAEDAQKVRNLATGVQGRRDVIEQTWSLADKAAEETSAPPGTKAGDPGGAD